MTTYAVYLHNPGLMGEEQSVDNLRTFISINININQLV